MYFRHHRITSYNVCYTKLLRDRGVRAVFKAEAQIQFESKVMQHSKKPIHVRDMLVQLCGDVPRLEMFARESAHGWDVFGNEARNNFV